MTPLVPLTFFIAGFSKCGTTSLSDLLSLHPQIALPSIKEPEYFLDRNLTARWEWYRGLFPDDLSEFRAVGDNSNDYSGYASTERLAPLLNDLYPGARFVFLARDPVARTESAFRQIHHEGVNYGIECPFDLHGTFDASPGVVLDSNYWRLISPFRAIIPEERILVVHFEDLVSDGGATIDRICSFIGVDPGALPPDVEIPHSNPGAGKLRDTRLLRRIKKIGMFGPRIARLSLAEQDRIFRPLRLRIPFPKSHRPDWTPEALQSFRRDVLPGARAFARTYGLPTRGWTRLQELLGPDWLEAHEEQEHN